MTRASKKIIDSTAGILNRHLAEQTGIAELLKDSLVRELVNEILEANAEGGRIVAAVETDGTLVGFVAKVDVPAAPPREAPEFKRPPLGPDE